MNRGYRFQGALLMLTCILVFVMCASLSDIKLKDNPGFTRNARTFSILHPIINSSASSQIVNIEDAATATAYEAGIAWNSEIEREGYVQSFRHRHGDSKILDDFFTHSTVDHINTSEMKKGDVARIRDYNYHRIEMSNPIDSAEYVILGQIQFFREITKESASSTFETTDIEFPIEFWIYQQGKDAGRALLKDPFRNSRVSLAVEIQLEDKTYHVEFQEQFNKRKVSVEIDSMLVAFFDLKPASFVSTKMKGSVMVSPDLSQDKVADVFSSYMLTVLMRAAMRRM